VDEEETLAGTLAALVSAAADGALRFPMRLIARLYG
jgi:hypothetical protein